MVLALAGCPGDEVATSGSSDTGENPGTTSTSPPSISASDTGAPPTSSPTTSETGDPVDETTVALSTTTTTTDSTTTGLTTSSTGSTTAPEALCGPPCDAPWVHDGDLKIDADTDLASLHCLVEVTGTLELSQVVGSPPAELANLRRIGSSLEIGWELEMTSLAGLECLEHIGFKLSLPVNPKLADISALANLEHVVDLRMWGSPLVTDLSVLDGVAGLRSIELLDMTGFPRLPIPGPDATVSELRLEHCHALTDLDALAGVPPAPMGGLNVQIVDAPKLTSVAGLADLWHGPVGVLFTDLPALQSLAGLEGLNTGEVGGVYLRNLPLVPDLELLAGIEEIDYVYFDGMPKVKSVAPLAGLRRVNALHVGSCSDMNKGTGMDGITTLSAFDKLESLTWLYISRNDALTQLPQFTELDFDIAGVELIGNPKLAAPQVEAFIAKHEGCASPPMQCSCDEDAPNP